MTKLNEKQEAFLELLFDKEVSSPEEAAKLAGYTCSVASIMNSKALTKAVLERSQSFTALHAPSAIMSILNVMSKPQMRGAANALNAAKEILDRGGLVKKDKLEVESTQKTAIVVLPQID